MTAGMFAQTIVGTAPENKNVILEEFTGINCQFCPDGHAIANAFKATAPNDIFLINIHSGGFANPGAGQPDFRTPFGAAIDAQSQLAGYPAGTINRHAFPGQQQNGSPAGATAQGRGTWAATGNITLGEASYLNMGIEAEIDIQTNIMTIHVEGYYTANSPVATNMLNIAIKQNNTTGPQSGANQGNNYVHNHRLIDMPLGQWGMTINNTTATTLVDETISYTIPADINGIPVEISELEVTAFMTETTQEIITGIGTVPTYTGLTNANDANLRSIADIDDTCSGVATPVVNVQNLGINDITSLDITYDVNGGTAETFTWTGTLSSLQSEDITLPEISFPVDTNYTVNVSIPNDDVNTNNTVDTSFSDTVDTVGTMKLTVTLDDWAQECSWNFTDSSGAILESANYTGGTGTAGDDRMTFNYTFNFGDECMTFNAFDTFGDGLTTGGNGGISLEDANGVVVYPFNANYGSGFSVQFDSDGILGANDINTVAVSIFPNPASTILNIANADNSNVEVYNILGQVMMTKSNISLNEELNVSQLVTGTYFVKISNGTTITTKKFIIAR